MSPIFIEHGYHAEPSQLVDEIAAPSQPAERANVFIQRPHEAQNLAQITMASSQSGMEEFTNKTRNEAEIFKLGNHVWLNLKNIQTSQLSKKVSWINPKYKVTKVINSHSVELDTRKGIWPRFYVDLLKRAAIDSLPS